MTIKRFLSKFLSLIKFALSAMSLGALSWYFASDYGFLGGVYTALLVWSLFVLCIPAAHGSSIIGFPLGALGFDNIVVEPYVWLCMVILNVLTYIFNPSIYLRSIATHLLYSIIRRPFPSGIVFVLAFPGTFYRYFYGVQHKTTTQVLIRQMLVIMGILGFLYFSRRHIITILGTSINA